MTHRYTAYPILFLLLLAAIQIKAQKWYTAEVARELGSEPCEGCGIGRVREDINPIQVGNGRITPVTMFYFDTIATYAQGRVVDIATGKPIKNAFIQVRYSCWDDCNVKAATSNETGFFRMGWVGCQGPKGGRYNRPLFVQAPGYQTVSTESVKFGGGAYVYVELAALPKRR